MNVAFQYREWWMSWFSKVWCLSAVVNVVGGEFQWVGECWNLRWWMSGMVNVAHPTFYNKLVWFLPRFHSLTLRKSIERPSVQWWLTSGHVCVYIVAFAISRWWWWSRWWWSLLYGDDDHDHSPFAQKLMRNKWWIPESWYKKRTLLYLLVSSFVSNF